MLTDENNCLGKGDKRNVTKPTNQLDASCLRSICTTGLAVK